MSNDSGKRPLRAIVAEESPAMRRWYAAALARVAGEIEECDSGWKLLSRLADDHPYDLVVASKWLPGWSGAQILAVLHAAGARVPFVLVAPFCDAGVRALVNKVPDAALVEDALDATSLADAAARVVSGAQSDRHLRVARLLRAAASRRPARLRPTGS
ncbi:MAG TPA: hypothetical protein VMZ28_19460 [Kofleriaceae bacterium]|nr:hypothetical protein [Kofleriaceae bacterium]